MWGPHVIDSTPPLHPHGHSPDASSLRARRGGRCSLARLPREHCSLRRGGAGLHSSRRSWDRRGVVSSPCWCCARAVPSSAAAARCCCRAVPKGAGRAGSICGSGRGELAVLPAAARECGRRVGRWQRPEPGSVKRSRQSSRAVNLPVRTRGAASSRLGASRPR